MLKRRRRSFKQLFLLLPACCLGGAIQAQTIQAPYSSNYSLITLASGQGTGTSGPVSGIPASYCGFAFPDASAMLMGSHQDSSDGAIYQVAVVRDTNGHITSFGSASLLATAAYLDCGLVFGPGGVLFALDATNGLYEYKPGSSSPDLTVSLSTLGVSSDGGALQFVPAGFPGAGGFKLASYSGQFYDITLTPDGSGTYTLSSATATVNPGGGPEGLSYVPSGSPQFSFPAVLVVDFANLALTAYPVNSDGNPSGSGTAFASFTTTQYPQGAGVDPITGDLIMAGWSSTEVSVYEIQGFAGSKLSAAAGATQSAMINSAFGTSLTVLVSDPFGNPVSGVPVTFAAPSSGASAALSATTATTGADGTAVVSATANKTAGTYTVSASAYNRSTTFSLTNVALSALTLSPASVVGGDADSQNTVTLTSAAPPSGAAITLSSSNSSLAAVPASAGVAGGATTSAPFSITTTAVDANSHATIKASDGTNTKSATLTVKPPSLSAVKLSPKSVTGGRSTTGNTATLNGPAPAGGVAVDLSSSDSSVATPPTSVTIAAGSTASPPFTITTTAVASDTPVTISASYGAATKTASLTVNAPVLSSLRLSPATVTGGHSTTKNKVTLNGVAPAGGAVVMLTSGDSSIASPPTTVTVPEGDTSVEFTITTTSVSSSTMVAIMASFGGVTKSANLTVNP